MSTYDFSKVTLTVVAENIVRIQVHDNVELETTDVQELFDCNSKLMQDRKYAIVLISGQYSTITPEARKLAADRERRKNRVAFAMVVNSLAQRLVGNFFIRFDKPTMPTRVFNTEAEAMEWVKTFEGIGISE